MVVQQATATSAHLPSKAASASSSSMLIQRAQRVQSPIRAKNNNKAAAAVFKTSKSFSKLDKPTRQLEQSSDLHQKDKGWRIFKVFLAILLGLLLFASGCIVGVGQQELGPITRDEQPGPATSHVRISIRPDSRGTSPVNEPEALPPVDRALRQFLEDFAKTLLDSAIKQLKLNDEPSLSRKLIDKMQQDHMVYPLQYDLEPSIGDVISEPPDFMYSAEPHDSTFHYDVPFTVHTDAGIPHVQFPGDILHVPPDYPTIDA
jgi:hypothetical protein